ncbi:hypothetical protein FA15DRAFT_664496, partial [Coprinopsis marcescibilis]
MVLWGESVDPAEIKLYELVDDKALLPKRQGTVMPTSPAFKDRKPTESLLLDPN